MEKVIGYTERLVEGEIGANDIDEPELFLEADTIHAVSQQPVLGFTQEFVIPISREVDHNLRSARSLMVAQHESEKVVDYFSELAKRVGSFFALPYYEVLYADNGLTEVDIQIAIEEGYARTGVVSGIVGTPEDVLELTTKFCPLEKLVESGAIVHPESPGLVLN